MTMKPQSLIYWIKKQNQWFGTVLDAEAFPSYSCISRFGNNHLCGGIIKDKYRILIATHCEINLFDTFFVGGIKRNGSDKQQELNIKRVLNHRDYEPVILENDISVIELQSALSQKRNFWVSISRAWIYRWTKYGNKRAPSNETSLYKL